MLKKPFIRTISILLSALLLLAAVPVTLFTQADDTAFVSENVLETQLLESEGIAMFTTTGGVEASSGRFTAEKLAAAVDGNTAVSTDVYGALDWNPARYIGAVYTLKDTFFCGEAILNSGSDALPETWRVYASDSLDTLYNAGNLLNTVTTDSGSSKVKVNRDVRYIAFVCTGYDGNMRVREFQLMTADKSAVFVPENAFRTKLQSASDVNMFVSGGAVEESTRFNGNGALAASTDGNTAVATDVYGALDWDPARYVGVLYALSEPVYAANIMIYSGFDAYKDTYRVYASDSIGSLYSADSIVGNGIVCGDAGVKIELNRTVRYVAFFCTEYNGNQRVKEFELWTGENPDAKTNYLQTALSSGKGIVLYQSSGTAEDSTQACSATALQKLTDGNSAEWADLGATLDWDSPRYPGVQFTLDNAYFCGEAVISAGINTDYPETWRIYASDSTATLYAPENQVGTDVSCTGTEQKITIEKTAKYIAFICTSYTGNPRPREFQVWSGKDSGGDAAPAKKVLTIGNSFAENASSFATEIAQNQGLELTFGYLKYPSCTIAQHYENAVNDTAAYKFALTAFNGTVTRTTVKDGVSEFATVREALSYTDWDIIVLQQGSTASYDYATYEKTDELMSYVRNLCPLAEVMVHETWSWATWAQDKVPENNFKNIEKAYHQMAAENGNLKLIPTGRAFEFARRAGLNVNDADNQHANAYGQYLAGACYVSAIFGSNIMQNTFGDGHPYFADVDMNVLRTAVKNAMSYVYDPNTSWDWADDLKQDDPTAPEPDAPNFIRRHLGGYSEVLQDLNTNSFSEGARFCNANAAAAQLATDGDVATAFEVYGALSWDYPKNIGLCYTLNAGYRVDSATVVAGNPTRPVTYDIYASDSIATLYEAKNRVGEKLSCTGAAVTVPVGREIQYVAFILSGYDPSAAAGDSSMVMEFDLAGSDTPIVKEQITWPTVPDGANLLAGASATEIIAPGGDFNGTKKYDYRFMDQQTESDLKYLTDGDIQKHFDIWSLTPTDKPGVLYDLGGYYDISHLHAWAGAFNSQLLAINGYKIYASDSPETLFKAKNLVFSYQNDQDSTGEMGINLTLKRVRYVAFLLTSSVDGSWRMREFAAYGTRSADQSEPVAQTSILEGLEPEYYGVATDNLADPTYMGASATADALSDGKRDSVEFWGGKDVANSKFVFIYNLYANYDLTGIDIYSFGDVMDTEANVHKGIKSAKIYVSRTFPELFTTTPVVLKDGYARAEEPDEESYFTAQPQENWKMARYIAFVFTIDDSHYGACRLEELKAFGTQSATQDTEPEPEKLPQYIDITADNGVVARIFALNTADDLSKLDAHLTAERSTAEKELAFVEKALTGYSASALYGLSLKSSDGKTVDTGGRLIRISIPGAKQGYLVACVDDFGAEIVSSGTLNGCLTVETETLRSYALVSGNENAVSGTAGEGMHILWVITICLGVLAGCCIGGGILFGLKTSRK